MQHVAIGDDIFLAFEPQLAAISCAGFTVQRGVIRISNRLGADKTLLEVSRNNTCCKTPQFVVAF